MLPTPIGQAPPPMPPQAAAPTGPPGPPGPSVQVKEEEKANLAAITVTSIVPEFWVDQPRLWFFQTEAILSPQKMSDDVKFNLVITKLSKEVIQQVTDLLMNPPASKKFDALKDRLLTIYEESETRQVQKLMSEMELGDQKPSQLLRRMRDLARTKIPDETLKILWQGHLPPAVHGIITVAESSDLTILAKIADKVMETQGTTFAVSEVRTSTPTASASKEMDTTVIINEIRQLNRRIDNLQRETRRNMSRGRSQNRGRSTSAQRSTSASKRPSATRRKRKSAWHPAAGRRREIKRSAVYDGSLYNRE
ncbi:unnamed protein product [Plutella xylostella]|uniref:(diamondback moth) hypothetical protein n=1 Tax=Plutella xylostella TaxID=51655 RepID=A0A8S4GCX0_PLUXY|nr:unnamed protein product [Plutella xylostella]